MTSGSRSSPAITSAGSPGNKCCNEKMSIDTKNSVGISCITRLARKLSIARFPRGSFSHQLQADHAHQPVRHLLVTFEPGRMREQQFAVVEINDRLVVE